VASDREIAAMWRALEAATSPDAPLGPNPRVGAVLLSPDGDLIATGHHRGAGTAHAEVDALAQAGAAARGATAVVTLEPCNHTGRTGPCSQALITAGVARVVYAAGDTGELEGGGAATLRAAGVQVEGGVLADDAAAVNPEFSVARTLRRPFVTWKFAATLDGRIAAADGTSQWISSPESRADVHALRAVVDAVLVGSGTQQADDPSLTVRDGVGALAPTQPLRVVMGNAEVPSEARVRNGDAEFLHLRTHDPRTALAQLHGRGVNHVLLEGGPTLAAAFIKDGLVDRVVAYLAPVLLGAGAPALGDAGISTITDALRLTTTDVAVIGGDVRITAVLNTSAHTNPARSIEDKD
jgi:diaminohydroxyphosphoribosylaminopyrimidine deaminase / 5-amino-6-(5-phosphoribosylamino)uracil reductase